VRGVRKGYSRPKQNKGASSRRSLCLLPCIGARKLAKALAGKLKEDFLRRRTSF
jgi:hypothetical protein